MEKLGKLLEAHRRSICAIERWIEARTARTSVSRREERLLKRMDKAVVCMKVGRKIAKRARHARRGRA